MYGETFYDRHTAQHQLQWSQIKAKDSNFLKQIIFLKSINSLFIVFICDLFVSRDVPLMG